MEQHGNTTRMLGGFLLGAAIGAGLALLLAPASGRTTRRTLVDKARDLKDNASEKLHDLTANLIHRRPDTHVGAMPEGREALRREMAGAGKANDLG